MKLFALAITLYAILVPCVSAADSKGSDCTGNIRFRIVDVIVESEQNALAAYQIDIRYDKEKMKIVGIEGGSESFSEPPFYDRSGLDGGRIIIAAFVDDDLAAEKGRTRVARLHVQTKGCPPFFHSTGPMAAAKPGGETIPVTVDIVFWDEGYEWK